MRHVDITTRMLIILLAVVFLMPPSSQAWAKHENDSLPRLRHDVSLGIGAPGLYPLRGSVYFTWGDPDPTYVKDSESSQLLPAFYGQYLYNVNRYIGLGAMLCYTNSGRKNHSDYYQDVRSSESPYGISSKKEKYGYADESYRFNIIAIEPVFRVYWFNRAHVAMYSKVGIGVALVFKHYTFESSNLWYSPLMTPEEIAERNRPRDEHSVRASWM